MTSDQLLARVEATLEELGRTGRRVTFTAVARAAGAARATLYRDATLRALIEEHRARQVDTRTLSGLSAEINHLRTALEAVAARVRLHEERLRRLEGRRAAAAPREGRSLGRD
jgi:hypothetical protein